MPRVRRRAAARVEPRIARCGRAGVTTRIQPQVSVTARGLVDVAARRAAPGATVTGGTARAFEVRG
jgi:hypothetical protein